MPHFLRGSKEYQEPQTKVLSPAENRPQYLPPNHHKNGEYVYSQRPPVENRPIPPAAFMKKPAAYPIYTSK